MLVLILASDQLVWRPLLAWADKFKIELTESATPATSWAYNLLRGAYLFTWIDERVWQPLVDRAFRACEADRCEFPCSSARLEGRFSGERSAGLLALWIGFEVAARLGGCGSRRCMAL